MAAEAAFVSNEKYVFEPMSITTYADGHRMLSITGAIIERKESKRYRNQMDLKAVPGGVGSWDELVDVIRDPAAYNLGKADLRSRNSHEGIR